MLRKLLKYDFKAVNKLLLIINGFVVFFVLLGRIVAPLAAKTDMSDTVEIVLFISVVLFYVLILTGSSFATYIIIANRFYKSLFSNEGYLSRTLPVTSSLQLVSKTIMGSVWGLINGIILVGSIALVFTIPAAKSDMPAMAEVLKELGYGSMRSFAFDMAGYGLMMILGAISSVIMIYLSIAIGQLLSSTHKVMASVAMYFAITTVTSIITSAVLMPTMFKPEVLNNSNLLYKDLMDPLLFYTSIMSLILGIVMYLVTNYIMKKKVNL